MIGLYRLGSFVPAPGVDIDAVQEPARSGRADGGILGFLQLFSRRCAHPVRHLRARDHALHHVVDHHADPRRRDPHDRAVAAAGCGRSAQDHPVDPLPHDRHRRRAVDRRSPSSSTTVAAASAKATTRPAARTFSAWTGAPRRAHPHRRHGAADVDGRAHHPARHRQRHVAADLRLGASPRFPAQGALVEGRERLGRGRHRCVARWSACCSSPSCSSSRASVASRCSSPSGWSAASMYGGQSTYIPLKVNQSGVIPIIFASSVLYLPHADGRGPARRGVGRAACSSWVDDNLADPTASSTSCSSVC